MQSLVRWNFELTVWLSILGSLWLFKHPELLVPDPEQLFGPLLNNLLIAAVLLAVNQLILWFARYHFGRAPEALLMGLLFLMISVGIQFYAKVNGIPLTPWISPILFYIGLSHCLYFWGRRNVAGG